MWFAGLRNFAIGGSGMAFLHLSEVCFRVGDILGGCWRCYRGLGCMCGPGVFFQPECFCFGVSSVMLEVWVYF